MKNVKTDELKKGHWSWYIVLNIKRINRIIDKDGDFTFKDSLYLNTGKIKRE